MAVPVARTLPRGSRLRRQAHASRADQAGIGGLETPEGTTDGPLQKDIPIVGAAERKVCHRQVAVQHRHNTEYDPEVLDLDEDAETERRRPQCTQTAHS